MYLAYGSGDGKARTCRSFATPKDLMIFDAKRLLMLKKSLIKVKTVTASLLACGQANALIKSALLGAVHDSP